ncbi:tripartite tricarboxylate transporter TctB family protein [Kocuria sp. LUK]|uniref:tripartite tricarboxylate transporter TctB family protein n=1 Tax=Kocuria TaxID=57493 RepID=UPI001E6053F5|nr:MULTISPECIES: tripartite tricarboxylate transporter TctB family protein [Kocuria]MCD1145243.1 tripartite tricarboxylate transporter TctB family protein [Kocuria sp. LUK]
MTTTALGDDAPTPGRTRDMTDRTGSAPAPRPAPAAHPAADAVTDAGGDPAKTPAADALPDDDLTPEQLAARWEAEGAPPAGPWANLGAGLVVTALAAGAVLLSLRMGLGTPRQPEPGMWPFAVALVALVLGLAQLVLGRRGGEGEQFSRHSLLSLWGLLTLVGLVALMPVVGFELPALLLSLVWMRFLGGETWRSAVLFSLLVVVVFYLVFISALGTSIPHLF